MEAIDGFKEYVTPELEVVEFAAEDVVVTSGTWTPSDPDEMLEIDRG